MFTDWFQIPSKEEIEKAKNESIQKQKEEAKVKKLEDIKKKKKARKERQKQQVCHCVLCMVVVYYL